MKIVFFGSGEFGLPTLAQLHQHFQLLMVITQPDRPAGRKRQLTATAVGQWAQQNDLPLIKTDNASDPQIVKQIESLEPDAGVVIAFGQKLQPNLIDVLGKTSMNLHSSLLPKYRGAAPINWAMINGEKETGLSVISLAQKMDAGLIYGQIATPIDPQETAGELHDRLAAMGPALLLQVLDEFQQGHLQGRPQDEAASTPAPKLHKQQGSVEFNQSADKIRCCVHGLTPWPGVRVTWVQTGNDDKECDLFLRRVATAKPPGGTLDSEPGVMIAPDLVAVADGAVRLLEVQKPGGRIMSIKQFNKGNPLRPGDRLVSKLL